MATVTAVPGHATAAAADIGSVGGSTVAQHGSDGCSTSGPGDDGPDRRLQADVAPASQTGTMDQTYTAPSDACDTTHVTGPGTGTASARTAGGTFSSPSLSGMERFGVDRYASASACTLYGWYVTSYTDIEVTLHAGWLTVAA